MIVSNLNDKMIENYKKVHPRFEAAFNALLDISAKNAEDGRYDIEGDNVYALVMTLAFLVCFGFLVAVLLIDDFATVTES